MENKHLLLRNDVINKINILDQELLTELKSPLLHIYRGLQDFNLVNICLEYISNYFCWKHFTELFEKKCPHCFPREIEKENYHFQQKLTYESVAAWHRTITKQGDVIYVLESPQNSEDSAFLENVRKLENEKLIIDGNIYRHVVGTKVGKLCFRPTSGMSQKMFVKYGHTSLRLKFEYDFVWSSLNFSIQASYGLRPK